MPALELIKKADTSGTMLPGTIDTGVPRRFESNESVAPSVPICWLFAMSRPDNVTSNVTRSPGNSAFKLAVDVASCERVKIGPACAVGNVASIVVAISPALNIRFMLVIPNSM